MKIKKLIVIVLCFFSINTFAANTPARAGVPPIVLINATNEIFIGSYVVINYTQKHQDYRCGIGYFVPDFNIRFSIDRCDYPYGKWPDNDATGQKATIVVLNIEMTRGVSADIYYDPKTRHWGEVNKTYGVLNLKSVGANTYVVTY